MKLKSYFILQRQYRERQCEIWSDWQDVDEYNLQRCFGKTVKDWKRNCKSWIDMGGLYRFRIIKRTDNCVWEI